jgi:hypothetical protein
MKRRDFLKLGVATIATIGASARAGVTLTGPSSLTVVQGQQVAGNIQLTKSGSGKPETATFSVTGLPAGASGKFSAATCKPTCTTTLTIATQTTTSPGTYPLTVKAQTPTSTAFLGISLIVNQLGGRQVANYYISTTGNDTTGDGSVGNPWASLHKACSVVSGVGDIINVAAGSYTDNTAATLAVGVRILGAGKATTSIATSASPYITAASSVPCVDGSNEISGITFNGGGTAGICIRSRGRNNQKIHDCAFTSFTGNGVAIYGKYGYDDSTGVFDNGACVGGEPTATYCSNGHQNINVWPGTTDWATGVEVYNNTFTSCKLYPNTIQGALIHDNTIDNSAVALGCLGNTCYFWSGCSVYNNTLTVSSNTQSIIGAEIWGISDDCKFYSNVSNGWFSLLENEAGGESPYSIEVYDNDFRSNATDTNVSQALEICYALDNVRIAGNIFGNTGGNNTYAHAISIHGFLSQANWDISRNIFLDSTGAPIEIDSTLFTGTRAAAISDIRIYNNVFDSSGSTNAILIENTSGTGTISGIKVRNNYFNTLTRAVGFSPNPPTGTISGNFYDHNMISAGTTGHVQSGGDSTFTIASNLQANGQFLATGDKWTNWYKPTPAGNLIDVGVNVGWAYTGTAPDIGAFEEPPVTSSRSSLVIHWAAA